MFLVAKHFPWLKSGHPLFERELRRINHTPPKFIHKLTDPWTALGYAALIHGTLFMLTLLGYGHFFAGMPIVLMPFLTPFGTPLAAGLLHSLLYWTMLIGICNYTVMLVGRDVETHMWHILRTAPLPDNAILGVKLGAVAFVWGRVLKTLVITRFFALLLVPVAIYLQHTSAEARPIIGFDFTYGVIFIAQPYVDAFLVAALSAFSALAISDMAWARLGAYSLISIVYGGLSEMASFWLMMRTPLGLLSAILVPFNHWAPLVAAAVPYNSQAGSTERILLSGMFYCVLPLAIGGIALWAAARLARRLA